jgi:hypothetical protein
MPSWECPSRALIEVLPAEDAPQPSYGTHFFQDLVEARIYPLSLELEDPRSVFNAGLLLASPNALAQLVPDEAAWSAQLLVVDLQAPPHQAHLELVMDGEASEAVGYLQPEVASGEDSDQ